MKSIIYYFSATGNSLFISRKIAENIENSQILSIVSEMKKDDISPDAEKIGFVFPLYFSGIPLIVENFIKKINIADVGYIFAVVTAGIPVTGAALSIVDKLLYNKNKRLNYGSYVKMVDNYLPIYDIPDQKEQIKINQKALLKAEIISKNINDKINKKTLEVTPLLAIQYKPWKKKKDEFDSVFFTDSKCNGCGICKKVCPTSNIKLLDKKPQWFGNCEFCLACIHHCPQKSIQLDKKSVYKRRYIHPEIKLSDIIEKK